jgi:hypothetical protein
MFCPKCSQEQVSTDLRFCSRCGFRLEAVGELLVNNGVPVQEPFARLLLRRDTRLGAKLLFMSGVIVPLALLASAMWDSPFPILAPAVVAILGITQIGYRLIVESLSEPRALPGKPDQASITDTATTRLGLPERPLLSMPSKAVNQQADVDPPTVTDKTTEKLREP